MGVIRKLLSQKGAVMVEYGLLVAGVSLICATAVALVGHKTSDMIGTVAAILPGAHTDDNAPIISGKVIETAPDAAGNISLDISGPDGIVAGKGTARLGVNLGIPTLGTDLVKEAKGN